MKIMQHIHSVKEVPEIFLGR